MELEFASLDHGRHGAVVHVVFRLTLALLHPYAACSTTFALDA
jgi:hypothetical protein